MAEAGRRALQKPDYVIKGVVASFNEGHGSAELYRCLQEIGLTDGSIASLRGLAVPRRPERCWSVGFFYATSSGASVGAHVDSDSVTTLQLTGARRWSSIHLGKGAVELLADGGDLRVPDDARDFESSRTWSSNDAALTARLRRGSSVLLQRGSALHIPSFSLHEVSTYESPAMSLSIGVLDSEGL